jgi:ubiquinone/menaquinone biosynthesis C-methylase UbiE
MNYFALNEAAERYSKGRPDFHSNTIKHIRNFLHLEHKLDNALDIACGTGLSTKALLEIAEEVYGTDISQEMLNLAFKKGGIHYAVAPAEQQPFADNSFNLLTVCSGVHWFDIDKFLAEAKRLLKSNSWLILYDNFITGKEGDTSFKSWREKVFLAKFPVPPRNDAYNWANENLRLRGFDFVEEEKFDNPVLLNKKAVINYFTSQSHIISAVERGETTYREAEDWLDRELSAFFSDATANEQFYFGNWIKFIQKIK